jgi:hypothetical protein
MLVHALLSHAHRSTTTNSKVQRPGSAAGHSALFCKSSTSSERDHQRQVVGVVPREGLAVAWSAFKPQLLATLLGTKPRACSVQRWLAQNLGGARHPPSPPTACLSTTTVGLHAFNGLVILNRNNAPYAYTR